MKTFNRIIWGIALIAVGVIIALDALGAADIDVFFDGWWTLFLIIPGITGLLTERDKTGSAVVLLIGCGLLLGCRDIISFGTLWKLVLPAIVILIGVKLIIHGCCGRRNTPCENGANGVKTNFTLFAGNDVDFSGMKFEGAELTAVFGAIKCDLTRAVFEGDATLYATAVFGGAEIIVPQGITVRIKPLSLFGSVEDERKNVSAGEGGSVLYINATAVFGGVSVKYPTEENKD